MTKKQGICTAVFLIFVILLYLLLARIIGIDKTIYNSSRQKGYYMQPSNSLDGVILGRSMVDTDWVSSLAWNQNGITIYPLSSNDQPFCITPYLIDEVRKKQNPGVFMIDVHGIREKAFDDIGPSLRVAAENMPFSLNKIRMIRAASQWEEKYNEYIGKEETDTIASDLSYFFGFINNHARWEKLGKASDKKRKLTLASSLVAKGEINYQEKKTWKPIPTTNSEWNSYAAAMFTELLDFCQKNEVPVLFVSFPTVEDDQSGYEQMNAAFELAEERNFPVLNLNTTEKYDELELDFDADFGDREHLNSKGAAKVTRYLADYLAEHYDLTDKRSDSAYSHWDESFELFCEEFQDGWGHSWEE